MKKQRQFDSFRCAWQGIWACVRQEPHMRFHLLMAGAVIIAGVLFEISKMEWIICLILFALVMGAELMNTAIEAAVDLACPRQHPKAKLAKDAAAGAVLVCAIFAAIAGLIIFVPKLMAFL